MMKAMPALLLLEWEGKGPLGGSRRFVLKILHDGGRGLVELGFYENLARRADGAAAMGGEVRHVVYTYIYIYIFRLLPWYHPYMILLLLSCLLCCVVRNGVME